MGFRQSQGMVSSQCAHLEGVNRVPRVILGACRRSKVQNVIQGAGTEEDFPRRFGQQGGQINRLRHVVKHDAEMRVRE